MSVRLAQRLVEPDYWTCPHGERQRPESVLTYGPEVADVCAAANFAPDPQQQLGLDLIFAVHPDGSPVSFSFCVICCRQNLKTGLFKQAVLGWLFVMDEPEVVWSSHEMSTTTEAQRELGELMLGAPALRKRMLPQKNNGIYYDNGSERIELAPLAGRRHGQRIMFKARTATGGRGLARRKLILDEAFALKPSMMGSLLPLMMAQQHPQVLYGSSAGKADSDVLRDIRDRGRAGSSPEMSYLEWCSERRPCADPECTHAKHGIEGCALDDPELWRKANPTMSTGRISERTVANMRQELPPEEFMRECLGWWEEPLTGAANVFAPKGWLSATIPVQEPPPVKSIGLAVSVDGLHGSIGAAGFWDDGRVNVGAVDRRRGTEWMVAEAKRIQAEHRCAVVIDGKGPASFLVEPLERAKVQLEVLNTDTWVSACAGIYDRVQRGGLTHMGHDELDDAVRAASWRKVGERRAFGRLGGDIDMLEAVTAAVEGLGTELPSVYEERGLVVL